MKRVFIVLPVLLLAVLAFSSFMGRWGDEASLDTEIATVRVGYLPMVSSLTYFVAVENGYFISQNLNISAQAIATSNSIAQDLVGGKIDAAIELAVVPLLAGCDPTNPAFKIFSTSSITSDAGFDGVVVRSNSPIASLGDLSGKRVAVFPGTTAARTLSAVFAKAAPNLPLPQLVPLDPRQHLQALLGGDFEAIYAYEPTLTQAIVEHGAKRIASSMYAAQLSPNPIGVAALNAAWTSENPRVAKSFVSAIDEAVDFIDKHPIEARQILAKYTGAKPDTAAEMNLMPMSRSSAINKAALENYIQILRDMSEINTSPIVDRIVLSW